MFNNPHSSYLSHLALTAKIVVVPPIYISRELAHAAPSLGIVTEQSMPPLTT